VDLKVVLGWHASTYMCTLLGYFGDVPQGNTNSGNSHIDNDEPEGNGALDIHLYLPVLAYLHACKISMGLTFKEWDQIIHRTKWFRREGNSLLCVWIDG